MAADSDNTLQMNIGDALLAKGKDGKSLKIFGFELPAGPDEAKILSGLLPEIQIQITDKGAGLVRRSVIAATQSFTHSMEKAAIAGNIGEAAWRFGLPLFDLTLGVARTALDGRRNLNALKREASTLLAANHNGRVGIGGVLGKVPSALAYERSRIFKTTKNGAFSQFTKLFNIVPQWIVGYWQYQDDIMKTSKRLYDPNPKVKQGSTLEEEKAALHQRIGGQTPEATARMYRDMVLHEDKVPAEEKGYDPTIDHRRLPFNPSKNAEINQKIQDFLHPASYGQLRKNLGLNGITPRLMLPLIGGIVGNMVANKILDRVPDVSAWQKIVALDKFVRDKKGRLSNSVNDVQRQVREIIVQHAADRGINKDALPSGDELHDMVKAIAKAITEEGLPPVAIAEILDDRNIVSFNNGGVSFEGELAANAEIYKYVAKYSTSVNSDFYNHSPFNQQDAAEALKYLPEEEKALFALCFPPGVLETAVKASGGSEEDIAEIAVLREEGKDMFSSRISNAMRGLLDITREELAAYHIPDSIIQRFESLQAQLNHKREDYLERHADEIAALLRDMAVTAKGQDFWTDYVAQTRERSGDRQMRGDAYTDRVERRPDFRAMAEERVSRRSAAFDREYNDSSQPGRYGRNGEPTPSGGRPGTHR